MTCRLCELRRKCSEASSTASAFRFASLKPFGDTAIAAGTWRGKGTGSDGRGSESSLSVGPTPGKLPNEKRECDFGWAVFWGVRSKPGTLSLPRDGCYLMRAFLMLTRQQPGQLRGDLRGIATTILTRLMNVATVNRDLRSLSKINPANHPSCSFMGAPALPPVPVFPRYSSPCRSAPPGDSFMLSPV